MTDATNELYTTFREHAALRERVTAMEGQLSQIAQALMRIESALAARPQQADHGSLALQRALDVFERSSGKGGASGPSMFLVFPAMIGAASFGALIMRFFMGG